MSENADRVRAFYEGAATGPPDMDVFHEDVEFRIEDLVALSFDDATVDGILCRWGLMLVPDMDAAAAEIRRVLRPGGRAALAVWGSPDDNDWMTAAGRSALELGLAERPDPDAPGPFRLSREGLVAEVLAHAGLSVETVEDVAVMWRAPALSDWWGVARDTSRALATILERATAEQQQAGLLVCRDRDRRTSVCDVG